MQRNIILCVMEEMRIFSNTFTENSKNQKILRVIIDKKLNLKVIYIM